MLPAELPLSLARAVVPAPPAMAQESHRAINTHQSRTPHVVIPSTTSNALVAHSIHTNPLVHGTPITLKTAQDQAGNAAVASTAMHIVPVAIPKKESHPGR
ncbi:hypothetical protein JOF56_010773 [Kibdelosporangium banguiense]|uniref:Uncharacterized protein n=1 Tax=Kibdelosporangium banguiense TaxID=1365924 RepID=A0ABS4U160_9PSEU|nr:hypothetical protein [Kibdelosporangium banguiense]